MIRRLAAVAALVLTLGLAAWGARVALADWVGGREPQGLQVLPDDRTGPGLARPLIVRGLPLVNAQHAVSAALKPRVVKPYQLTPEASRAFIALRQDAAAQGLRIVCRFGYRSYATQEAVMAEGIKTHGSRKKARALIAEPGHSEHQLGLAVDVAAPKARGFAFAKTREFRWLRRNAHRYGFILRYPDGKQSLTGIHYEPWHYRYIGVGPAADFGANSTLTLEEYLGGR